MNDTVIIALISLLGTLSGTFAGILTANKLTDEKLTDASRRMDAMEQKAAGCRPVC